MNSIRIVLHSVSFPALISYAWNLYLPVELVVDECFTPTRTDSQCTPNEVGRVRSPFMFFWHQVLFYASILYAWSLLYPSEHIARESFIPTRMESRCKPKRAIAYMKSIRVVWHSVLPNASISYARSLQLTAETVVDEVSHWLGWIRNAHQSELRRMWVHSNCLSLSFIPCIDFVRMEFAAPSGTCSGWKFHTDSDGFTMLAKQG